MIDFLILEWILQGKGTSHMVLKSNSGKCCIGLKYFNKIIVEEHVYSRGQFVKKAIHWASCVQGT